MNMVLEQDAKRYAGGGYPCFNGFIGKRKMHRFLLQRSGTGCFLNLPEIEGILN